LVTGAAGFIGSHLTDRLLSSALEVTGFDNLSSGSRANLEGAMRNARFRFFEGDLLDLEATARALGECELVFHLAADPEVRLGAENPDSHFRQNPKATYSLLEAIRSRRIPTKLVFASTSTVYGEPTRIPTPEDYGPLLPISVYGATKLGCEALATSYTQLLPLQVVIFRFANVVGSRARHGVVYDFLRKLQENPRELEVLGDGTQSKSYLHVKDCVDAFLTVLDERLWRDAVEIYNIGTEGRTDVMTIARIVTDAMGLKDVKTRTTQTAGGRAWPGDIRTMQVDITKIKMRGWKPKRTSEDAVRAAAKELMDELSSSR